MVSWRQNLTCALRRISKSPGLAAAAVVSIGLGIAANATIFAMVSRFVLRSAPVGDPSTLMSLHTTHDGEQCCNNFPWPLYIDLRDQAKSFSGVAAYCELVPASISGFDGNSRIDGKSQPARVWGQAVTSNYFEVAQVGMTLGRGWRAHCSASLASSACCWPPSDYMAS